METSNHINKTTIEHDKVLIDSESQTTQTTQTLELSSFQRAQKKYKQKPEVIEKNKMHIKNHYKKNKEAILEKRRKRLEEDPEYAENYRKKNAESSKRYREKKKLEKLTLLEEEKK
jgi:hypothetical protein